MNQLQAWINNSFKMPQKVNAAKMASNASSALTAKLSVTLLFHLLCVMCKRFAVLANFKQ